MKTLVVYLMAGGETPALAEAAVEAGEGGGELCPGAGRARHCHEVEPAVRRLGGEPQPLVRRRRGDELDATEVRPLPRREVRDDQRGGSGGARIVREAFVAVSLEQ